MALGFVEAQLRDGVFVLTSGKTAADPLESLQPALKLLPQAGGVIFDLRPGIVVLFSTAILIQGPGTITGFQDGLEFANVDSSRVIQVTATRNSADGFVVIGTPSTNNVFQGNVATLNRRGISMIGGRENKILNNLVMNNEDGIDLVFADLNKIYANTATNNTLVGISLRGTQNEIGGNTAVGNGREDMFDSAPNCDDNRWLGNRFVTANQSCIQ